MKENLIINVAQKEEKVSSDQVKVAATGFLSLFSLVGIMFYGLPFFYDFWVVELGWSRATVTSANVPGKIIAAFFGFFAGWVIDRFGPRKVMLFGILAGGFALIGLSTVTSLWQFYFFYTISALGYLCGGPLPNQVLTSRWFTKSRGKAMGIAYLGIGVGGMLVPQITKWLNINFGWHQALMSLGVLMIILAFPMAWYVKESPKGFTHSLKPQQHDSSLKSLLKEKPFYLLLVGSMCAIGAVSGTIQNLKLFFSLDMGYSQERSANVISLILLSSIIGRLLMGWLADILPKRKVMILISVIIAVSIPLLNFAEIPGVIYLFAFIFGIGLGGDYMIIPLMAADLFGVKSLGRIMGIILSADGLADAFSPMLVGWLRDKLGSYAHGFAALILLALIAIASIYMLPKKKKIYD